MDFVKITRLKASCMTLAMGVAAVQTFAAGSGGNESAPFFLFEVCQPVETQVPPGGLSFAPGSPISKFPEFVAAALKLGEAKIAVLEQPRFGSLTDLREVDRDAGPLYRYEVRQGVPNGTEDRVVFLVEVDGKRMRVIERFVIVFNSTPESTDCDGTDYYVRRISQFSKHRGQIHFSLPSAAKVAVHWG